MKRLFFTFLLLSGFVMVSFAQDLGPELTKVKRLIMDKNFEGALTESKSLIEAEGTDSLNLSMAYSYAGIASQELGKSAEAISFYRNALLYKVPRLDIYDMMINLTSSVNDNEGYEFALLEKLAAFPEFEPEVQQRLASHYLKTKKYDSLLKTSTRLTELNAGDYTGFYYKAVAYQKLKKIKEAQVEFKKVLELDPDHLNSNLGLGMILYKTASATYNAKKKKYEALKSPSRLDYDNYRKSLESSKAVYSEALKYILKAYELKPKDNLKPVIANIYTRLGDKDKAAQYL